LTQKSFSVMLPTLLQAGNSLSSPRGGVTIQTIPALKSHALKYFQCSCKQKQCLYLRVCADNPKDINALSRPYFSVSLLLLQEKYRKYIKVRGNCLKEIPWFMNQSPQHLQYFCKQRYRFCSGAAGVTLLTIPDSRSHSHRHIQYLCKQK
jgi:hypothetical protein